MKNTRKLLWVFCFISAYVNAQEIQITNIQKKGEDISVTYNLIDERIDRSYSIHLYTSQDNFIQPVKLVKGDVGVDISVGPNKTITWKAKEELGADFTGGMKLEIKGQIYVPFVELDGIEEDMIIKRGKPTDLVWFGGRGDNILSVELYRADQLVKSFEELPNTGSASLVIPTNVKPGDNYMYRISDSRNRDEVVFSNKFIVQRKIPLIPKIAGGTFISIAGYFLIKSLIPVVEPDISVPPTPER
ncbi:MAG: hypothetical protein AB8B73_08900 [Ekhidna sp.]